MSRSQVVVVGGGLAGLAAGLEAADSGARVILLERRPRLGGATSSFRRGELEVDNGQHVFLRCCTAYRTFLRRLGVEDRTVLQERLDVPVVAAGGGAGRLRRSRLPAPLHLAGALAGYRLLPPLDRARAVRAALALRRVRPDDPAADAVSFGSWLTGRGQRPVAVERLWELLTVATLNARASEASLALAATVVRRGLLTEPGAADIGWSAVPLSRLHAEPAAAELRRLGAQIRCGAVVEAVRPAAAGFTVETRSGPVPADAVVLAVPNDAVGGLLPDGALADPQAPARLGTAAILNVHVVYDRPVTALPFLAAVDSPVQWVFDRTGSSGLRRGQYLAMSISAADADVAQPVAALRERYLPALSRLLPAAASAQVVDSFVTREPAATFRQSPGAGALRPAARTAVPRLALAGAWTRTDWPATMEGAVRSGRRAAQVVLADLRRPAPAGAGR
ncbi:FAD-dependent oxidoreductase [Geodermatophilus sp. DF01-2]|uniref:hydroxysqualene dehydroxylase HpnE n=1 Tax=Geodermatophilus sp. DF01-2 TaxID=2559610 RepID=UPI0010742F53|nr:hydroxysqualene dehydroxylase HpnE [Geodermatophilus sp. DF01_2]TFV63997.1 FAD-dependent oxidoreductase [Geodermatophilus sp. DF01_2]